MYSAWLPLLAGSDPDSLAALKHNDISQYSEYETVLQAKTDEISSHGFLWGYVGGTTCRLPLAIVSLPQLSIVRSVTVAKFRSIESRGNQFYFLFFWSCDHQVCSSRFRSYLQWSWTPRTDVELRLEVSGGSCFNGLHSFGSNLDQAHRCQQTCRHILDTAGTRRGKH
jgi:hypothetical protein